MIRLLLLATVLLAAGCRDTVPAADGPRPGSLTVGVGGSVGMAGGVVSGSR